jgi:hypothetical protein
MYYFAYSSGLNRKQMLEHYPDSKPKSIVIFPNYKSEFINYSGSSNKTSKSSPLFSLVAYKIRKTLF